MEQQPQQKKVYVSPQLKQWGTLEDLTQVGFTHPGFDARLGSINPPSRDPRG